MNPVTRKRPKTRNRGSVHVERGVLLSTVAEGGAVDKSIGCLYGGK